eukprot:gene11197-biopygen22867
MDEDTSIFPWVAQCLFRCMSSEAPDRPSECDRRVLTIEHIWPVSLVGPSEQFRLHSLPRIGCFLEKLENRRAKRAGNWPYSLLVLMGSEQPVPVPPVLPVPALVQ